MIYWKNIYDINIPQVNDERKFFFSLLNRIEERGWISQKSIYPLITKFVQRLETSFEGEEKNFEKRRCPKNYLDKQKIEHLEFIKEIYDIINSNKIEEQFISTAKSFIINHIIGTDVETNKYLRESYVHKYHNMARSEVYSDSFNEDSLVQWGPYFETRIPMIDQQHMVFIIAINDLAINYSIYTSDIVAEILEELIEYADVHFNTEETLMAQVKDCYPDMESHMKKHKEFVSFLHEKLAFVKNSKKYNDTEEYEKILESLIEWITEHIVDVDKKFAEIYNNSTSN